MKNTSRSNSNQSIIDLKIYIYAIPVVVPLIVLYLILSGIDISEFPYDNVRYAYSAIFQGFAALLAIMITAILITLQNIHNQKFSIEEKIYKILKDRYPEYIPTTITQTEKYVRSKEFPDDLWIKLSNRALNQDDVGSIFDDGVPEYHEAYSTPPPVIMRITEELRRNFDFLSVQRNHERRLGRIFIGSLGLTIVVIIYSLTALIMVPPSTNDIQIIVNGTLVQGKSVDSSPLFIINPIYVLIICAFLVFLTLMIIMQFMMSILNIWKLKTE